MNISQHKSFAKILLSDLAREHRKTHEFEFVPDRAQSRNAAKAMTSILCHRLFEKSEHRPQPVGNTTFEWNDGIFNCRNIADRDHLCTNIRRSVANAMRAY